jgi:hypothetical protein
MANPPITIGPFDNVPAPGSPIRSDWAQDISQYVTDNIGGISNALDAMLAGLAGGANDRLRIYTAQVTATTDAAGAVTVTIPAGTFAAPPVWVAADDFFVGTAPSNPSQWMIFKPDQSVMTATSVRVVAANFASHNAQADTPVGFRFLAIGTWL